MDWVAALENFRLSAGAIRNAFKDDLDLPGDWNV